MGKVNVLWAVFFVVMLLLSIFSSQSTFELLDWGSGIHVTRTAHTSIFRKPIRNTPARGGSPNFEIHFYFLRISVNLNLLSFFSDFFFFFCEMQLAIVPARLSELSGCCLLHSSVLNTYSKLYNYALTEKDEHSCSFHYVKSTYVILKRALLIIVSQSFRCNLSLFCQNKNNDQTIIFHH